MATRRILRESGHKRPHMNLSCARKVQIRFPIKFPLHGCLTLWLRLEPFMKCKTDYQEWLIFCNQRWRIYCTTASFDSAPRSNDLLTFSQLSRFTINVIYPHSLPSNNFQRHSSFPNQASNITKNMPIHSMHLCIPILFVRLGATFTAIRRKTFQFDCTSNWICVSARILSTIHGSSDRTWWLGATNADLWLFRWRRRENKLSWPTTLTACGVKRDSSSLEEAATRTASNRISLEKTLDTKRASERAPIADVVHSRWKNLFPSSFSSIDFTTPLLRPCLGWS